MMAQWLTITNIIMETVEDVLFILVLPIARLFIGRKIIL
jgi:hypothetical protein